MTEERVMVLSGASRGLGAAVAERFAADGFGIAISSRDAAALEQLRTQIEAAHPGAQVLAQAADVTDRAQVKALFDATLERFGRVDILGNFAGFNRDASFLEMSDEDFDSVVAVHLRGHFVCCQEFVRHNPDRPGVIINLGAPCGLKGRQLGANYCSAKGGIQALTKCLALELAPRVRVNCLVPGAVATEEVVERYQLETPEGLQRMLDGLPLGRLGALEDVLQMVRCMLDAEFTTGQTFFVNGGDYMH